MKWTPGDRGNIEDLRGRTGGGMRAMPMGIGGVLVLLLLSWFTGVDFLSLVGGGGGPAPTESASTSGAVASSPAEERSVDFVDAVMGDAQSTWQELLGPRYRRTTVRLFRDAIQTTGCGYAESASGPFYCPGDHYIYLDLGFFDELRQRFGASGEFAEAYVVAHELGHHVQSLLGTESQTRQQQARNPSERNVLSVRLELQADCYAGVWAHATAKPGRAAEKRIELENGDLEQGLNAAAAIGDDRIQRMSTGRVFPEKFTHGTSEQRVAALRRGFASGDPQACDTFQ
ncbi:MAG TPA: neutral zinc metallopeptidase [Vicinamibacterales bacterium]|nr:neutral zinc metallopeptidase [Vicinamibacterales bacterium]